MKKQEVKLLIADDHEIIRQGLKSIISFEEDMEIVGEAENGEKAINILGNKEVDIALLDCNMPVLGGLEVLKYIKNNKENTKVIMLTVENDRKTILEAIDFGADGYLLKDSAGTEIVNAIRAVKEEEKYIDKSLVSMLFTNVRIKGSKEKNPLDGLSKRELEVLLKISEGFSNKEIGEKLYLSEKTVKNYVTNIFRKINVDDRVHAAIFAIESNIQDYYLKG